MPAGVSLHDLDVQLLIALLGIATLLVLAFRTGVPYPVLLVLGGIGLGAALDAGELSLSPELVLVIFLPPLLYAAAFFASLRDLRSNVGAISMLSIGLVVFTTFGVGLIAHAVIPGLSWPAAFVLGAVLSPTDPVAASEIAGRLGAPRRFVATVEGESLVNDATALVVYKVALTAAVTGSFSALDAVGSFAINAVAGVAVGIAVGWVVARVRSAIEDPPTEIAISLMTPYFAYLPAEAIGVSAVLAAVVSGIWLGWRSPRLIAPETRIQAFAFWEILVFVLNAALFLLVGLQLPTITEAVADQYSVGELIGYSALSAAAVIGLRFVWVPLAYLPAMSRRAGRRQEPPSRTILFLIAFTGMRGAVSLAAALAIPESVAARDLIVFLTYAVVLVTVVGQGLLLPGVIKALGAYEDPLAESEREAEGRLRAAHAALARLDALLDADWVQPETRQRMYDAYEFRIARFTARLDASDDGGIEAQSIGYQRLRREVIEAEREEVIRLRNTGVITDTIMRRIERDLDLEDARLELGRDELG